MLLLLLLLLLLSLLLLLLLMSMATTEKDKWVWFVVFNTGGQTDGGTWSFFDNKKITMELLFYVMTN